MLTQLTYVSIMIQRAGFNLFFGHSLLGYVALNALIQVILIRYSYIGASELVHGLMEDIAHENITPQVEQLPLEPPTTTEVKTEEELISGKKSPDSDNKDKDDKGPTKGEKIVAVIVVCITFLIIEIFMGGK